MRSHSGRPSIGSSGGRGRRWSASSLAGSITSASAGRPSVTRFTHSRCSANIGSGNPMSDAPSVTNSSAALPPSRYTSVLRMLS